MLNFSKTFNQSAHWQLMRDVLEQIFSVPKGHKRSKPFYDHVISFTLLDGRIWLRNYQVTLPGDAKARYDGEETSLTGDLFPLLGANVLSHYDAYISVCF